MKIFHTHTNIGYSVVILTVSLLFVSCSPSINMLNKIPTHSIIVKVLDQNDEPIQGAQVEASNGRASSTEPDGSAKVRFGSVGIYSVTVAADNHMPVNFVVTMPGDDSKTFTRHLSDVFTYSRLQYGNAGMYPLMFNYLFSSYGYGLALEPYQEGEQTTWEITAGGDKMIVKKSFLKVVEDNKEWWQVSYREKDSDDYNYVADVLFSKDRKSVLRYREKINDGEVQEKPVSEGWYHQPAQLTEESIDGAVSKRNVQVSTEAGNFTANLLDFGVSGNTSLKIWKVSDDVPGGVVQYETTNGDDRLYKSKIISYGKGAKSELGSY